MNKMISKVGAAIVTITTAFFALCMLFKFDFGGYLVCIFLAIGYVIMAVGFWHNSDEKHKVAATAGILFAAIYAVLIFLVYFSQITSVRNDSLTGQAEHLLNYSNGSLMFNYDLLGYGMMALSTFFIGLTINAKSKQDKWLKALLLIHGLFFFSCLIMPITGVFSSMMEDGKTNMSGVIALEFWCLYFIPIGVLSFLHFNKKQFDY